MLTMVDRFQAVIDDSLTGGRQKSVGRYGELVAIAMHHSQAGNQ